MWIPALVWTALHGCGGPVAVDGTEPPTFLDTDDTGTPTESTVTTTPGARVATWTDGTWTTTVEVDDPDADVRTYTLSTDHPLRDGAAQTRTVTEVGGEAVLRSGSLVHDALFALAMQELRAASVSEITDGAFADGAPQPCDCFETGEKWTYVWTRDTAYAAHLALGWFDPERAANSLRYKLSAPKASTGEAGLYIVQDTGTGGSWPVSTDRATWALGATATLPHLVGAVRADFEADAAEALVNTALQDHEVVLAADGLMRGEQSFLDWREQTYPLPTADDVTMIAQSRALGTNLAHLHLLRSAARLAADPADAAMLTGWADDLAASIDGTFWREGPGFVGWSSWSGPALDPGPREQRDLLSTALAVLVLDDGSRGLDAVADYPRGPVGPPVIWPNHPGAPIYHNRGQWPFVTAYDLWAARRVKHAEVFQHDADALVRGAVLNLSNLENLEWFTGEPWVDAGDLSGPVVNSERQLWSVAGYLSLWLRGVLGLELSDDGSTLAADPFLSCGLRDAFGEGTVELRDLPWQGGTVDVQLTVPAAAGSCAAWALEELTVDGVPYPDGEVPVGDIADGAVVALSLAPHPDSAPAMHAVAADTLAPPAPSAPGLSLDGDRVQLSLDVPAGTTVDVLRDGQVVAEGRTGPTWTDPDTGDHGTTTRCWSVVAVSGDLRSHRSPAACWWGAVGERVQVLDAYDIVAGDGLWSTDHGRPHIGDWGDPDHTLAVRFRPHTSGPHLLQVGYSNGSGPISTGITAAHKWASIAPVGGGPVVAEGPVVLPQTAAWDIWRESSTLAAELDAGVTYELTLSEAPGIANMSWLEHFAIYTGGLGGGPDAYGAANIAEIKLLALDGVTDVPPGDLVPFDGVDDLGKHAPQQVVAPGATLQPWEAFALDWDDDFLYVSWVGVAFEDPFVPAMLYLQADPGGPPSPGPGMDYSGLTPALPFTPTHAITARVQHDAGDGLGPWSGVWEADGAGGFTQIRRLEGGVDVHVAADLHTLSIRVPRYLLADATTLRVAGHVVNGLLGSEWVDTVPATHTPWTAGGGTAWQIDLSGSHDPADW